MLHSNVLIKIKISLITAAVLIVGCTKPDRSRSSDNNGASFTVVSVKGSAIPGPVKEDSVLQAPEYVTVGFIACLEDRTNRQKLRGQSFQIKVIETGETIDRATNSGGCLSWNENIQYNHFAGQSTWVTLEREITGTGTQTGTRRIAVGVNPWAAKGESQRDSQQAVVFLRNGDEEFTPPQLVEPSQSLNALAGENGAPSELLVQDVKVRAIPDGEGEDFMALVAEVEMNPKIKLKSADGSVRYLKVTDGSFEVTAQVMATRVGPKAEKVLLMQGDTTLVANSFDGLLKAEFKWLQKVRANQSNLELVLKVKPRGISESRIKPFNGVFKFGYGTQLVQNSGSLANICRTSSSACDYETVIKQASNYDALLKAGYLHSNAPYIFSNIKLRFTSVLPGETATQRTVAYTASTCITSRQSGKPLVDTPILIEYKNPPGTRGAEGKIIEKSTDESGCLNWSGEIFHKYYDPEEYFENIIQIRTTSGYKRDFKFFLNPWDDKFTFGWDEREFDKSFSDTIKNRKKIKSRFFIGSFGYHTVRFLYNIDPFMDLEVKKTVLMELWPRVLRYSGIINARKMTESLRDGIYLLKVAIQKNYLDPRDNSKWLIRNSQYRAELQNVGGQKLAAKEFVTTNMALVRVVDGLVIYPIELTMRDLRLMRVRANFMVQLETVDERLIQAYHVFKKSAVDGAKLEERLRSFKAKLGEQGLTDLGPQIGASLNPEIERLVKDREALEQKRLQLQEIGELNDSANEVQLLVQTQIEKLRRRLEGGGQIGQILRSAKTQQSADREFHADEVINDNFVLDDKLLEDLETVLKVNDFSEVRLPSKDDIDLNLFIEKDSGLERRSFVGPVIFLSNAYKDSVRATDNLDEACPDSRDTSQETIRSIQQIAMDSYEDIEALKRLDGELSRPNEAYSYDRFFGGRGKHQNNNYEFNPYFGALSHFCRDKIVNVDDLIERETEIHRRNTNVLQAASLKYNFLTSFPFEMDYLSLTGETLEKVKAGCLKPVSECLVKTSEFTIPVKAIADPLEENAHRMRNFNNVIKWENLKKYWVGEEYRARRTEPWRVEEYPELFFKRNRESRVALCNLMSNRVMNELHGKGLLNAQRDHHLRESIGLSCVGEGGLVHDVKLHIEKTGDYTFLGGLNLNFNVGDSFSFSRSKSWSGGFDLVDLLGGGLGALKGGGAVGGAVSNAIKPLSLKVSSSASESEGTNVSESTYLVSQIAKFGLDLLQYEYCSVIRLSDITVTNALKWIDTTQMADLKDEKVWKALTRGLMVCQGSTRVRNKPRYIEEMYFYFTQHFTEGDMLDQADLYNHPWLLALRGFRDFAVFVSRIKAQQVTGLGEYLKGVLGAAKPRSTAWALDHMYELYRNVLPSFPGFYTLPDENEDIRAFLLQQTRDEQKDFSKVDLDPLGEIRREMQSR